MLILLRQEIWGHVDAYRALGRTQPVANRRDARTRCHAPHAAQIAFGEMRASGVRDVLSGL